MRVPIALVAVLVLAAGGCAHARGAARLDAARAAKMDWRLRQVAASGRDTVIGVFIRTTRPAGPADIRQLEGAGARVGTVTGSLLTAEIPANRLAEVAGLELVSHMEMSRTLRPQAEAGPRAPLTPAPDGAE